MPSVAAAVLLGALLSLQEQAAPLLEGLRSDKAEVREDATRKLAKMGTAILPDLEKLAEDGDLEVAGRARSIIESIRAQAAAAVFETLEKTLQGAGTVKASVRLHRSARSVAGSREYDVTHTLLLCSGNKANLRFEVHGRDGPAVLISDGSTLNYDIPQDGPWRVPTPSGLNSDLVAMFHRFGSVGMMFYMPVLRRHLESGKSDVPDIKAIFQVSEFMQGKGDGDSRLLTYVLRNTNVDESTGAGRYRMTLRYSPRTNRILSREWKGVVQGEEVTATETYDELVLDSELPGEAFKLKAGK